MNRTFFWGVAIFFAVIGIALLGGDNQAVAGHGCHGCGGCYGYACGGYAAGCYGCGGVVCAGPACGCYGGCYGVVYRRPHRVFHRRHYACAGGCYGCYGCAGYACGGCNGGVIYHGGSMGMAVQKGGSPVQTMSPVQKMEPVQKSGAEQKSAPAEKVDAQDASVQVRTASLLPSRVNYSQVVFRR